MSAKARITTNRREKPYLLGVVASYMNTHQRWVYFEHLLKSVQQQTTPLDRLFIGMSFPSKEKMSEANPKLKAWQKALGQNLVKFILCARPLTQGEMWGKMWTKYLSKKIPKDSWILFGDDDDLWHPNRVQLYRQGVESVRNLDFYRECIDVRVPCYAEPAVKQPTFTLAGIATATDVDRMLDKGAVVLKKTILGNVLEGRNVHGGNYVDHCVPSHIFGEFLQESNAFMLRNKQCDVMFQTFVLRKEGKQISIPEAPWMYFWRKHSDATCNKLTNEVKWATDSCGVIVMRFMSRLGDWETMFDAACNQCFEGRECTAEDREKFKRNYGALAREFVNQYPVALQKRYIFV